MATPDEVTGPINLGNPHEIPVRELAERVIAMTGCWRAATSAAPRSNRYTLCSLDNIQMKVHRNEVRLGAAVSRAFEIGRSM